MTAATAKPARWPRVAYRWELVVWLWLAFFCNQADRQLFNVVLPSIKADLGLSDVQLGLVATMFTVALAVMVPIAGFAGDRFSRKRLVVASLFSWSLATLVTGFGSGLVYLIVVRSLATGVGEGFYAPSANALLGANHTETRARAMSIYQTSVYAGVVASGLIGGAVADRLGWRAAFWVFGAGGAALAGLMAWRLRPDPRVQAEAAPRSDGLRAAASRSEQSRTAAPRMGNVRAATTILGTRTVIFFLIACCGMIFVNIGYLTWMPTYLYERFGLSLARAGFSSMLAHHVFAVVGVLVGGWLSDRYAPRRPRLRLELQALGLLLGAPFLLLLGRTGDLTLTYAALAGFGFFRGIYDSNTYPVLFSVIEPRLHATASGLVIAIAFLFGSFAPVTLAVVKGTFGLAAGLSSLSLVYVVAGLAAFIGAQAYFDRDYARVRHEVSEAAA